MSRIDSQIESYPNRHTTTHHDELTQWYKENQHVQGDEDKGQAVIETEKRPEKGVELATYYDQAAYSSMFFPFSAYINQVVDQRAS